ncbi:MAG: response regulator, partial [Candidatus Manganitrophaceae bacterium]
MTRLVAVAPFLDNLRILWYGFFVSPFQQAVPDGDEMPQKILVIDDNTAVQKLVELALQKEGYDVTSVDNGISALDLAFKNPPDLILADYPLEGINLFTFIQKIRQKEGLTTIPIIPLINATESYDPTQLALVGIQVFLRKPIDSRELVQAVKQRISPGKSGKIAPEKDPERSLSDHFPAPEKEAMQIEELLGWSNVEGIGNASKRVVESEATLLGSIPSSIKNGEDPPQRMEEEATQFFLNPPTSSPTATPAESPVTEVDPSLEETRYFNTPWKASAADTPNLTEGAHRQTTSSLPKSFEAPSLDELLRTQDPQKTEEKSIPPLSTSETIPTPSVGPSAPSIDRSQIDELLRKNVSETVEKVVWELLPGLLQSAFAKPELKELIEKITWEVIPPLAEVEIKKEIKRLQ